MLILHVFSNNLDPECHGDLGALFIEREREKEA